MRPVIAFLLCLITSSLMSQTSVVYKRNPATGQLEVYESRGGLPTGQPLYKIKKNVYGYLEIENSGASQDPFTKKPDYSSYNNFKPYQLPAKEIFETLETINKRYEYDNITSDPNKNSSNEGKEYVKNFFQQRSKVATALFKFYNSNVSFPKTLANGWYEVVNIYDNEASSALGNEAGKDYKYGIAKVQDNKIVEYYENCNSSDLKTGFVFQKMKLDVISPIANCKSTFRKTGSDDYSSVYFLDNILDYSKQIPNPEFGFYSIYTSFNIESSKMLVVQVVRNYTITREEVAGIKVGQYSAILAQPNPSNNDCNNSLMTLAFKKTSDKFSIGIVQTTEKVFGGSVWLFNNLTIPSGNCQSTILTQ